MRCRDESEITTVDAAGAEDVDLAVAAARKALTSPSWRHLSGSDRGELMYRLAELTEKHRETLATIETWDNGKPYSVAYNDDLGEVIAVFKYYGGWAVRTNNSFCPWVRC
jgi:aldehyde dehydrogenase (NAD+)